MLKPEQCSRIACKWSWWGSRKPKERISFVFNQKCFVHSFEARYSALVKKHGFSDSLPVGCHCKGSCASSPFQQAPRIVSCAFMSYQRINQYSKSVILVSYKIAAAAFVCTAGIRMYLYMYYILRERERERERIFQQSTGAQLELLVWTTTLMWYKLPFVQNLCVS
jgi:hypothetical protein